MKIEKINEKQIKIFLNQEDLQQRNLKITELAYGSEKAERLFRDMMEEARKEFNFSTESGKLIIEAVPLSAESIILIITKITSEDDIFDKLGALKHLQDVLHPNGEAETVNNMTFDVSPVNDPNNICVYSFNDLDTVSKVSSLLKSVCEKESSLYKYNNIYYLFIDITENAHSSYILSILSEYGERQNFSAFSEAFFLEHSEIIVSKNAVTVFASL